MSEISTGQSSSLGPRPCGVHPVSNPHLMHPRIKQQHPSCPSTISYHVSHLWNHRPHLQNLEEEIGRWQCKKIFNHIKSNVVAPETSGCTTARPEHPNTDEEEKMTLEITL